jgi:hypothetical protein
MSLQLAGYQERNINPYAVDALFQYVTVNEEQSYDVWWRYSKQTLGKNKSKQTWKEVLQLWTGDPAEWGDNTFYVQPNLTDLEIKVVGNMLTLRQRSNVFLFKIVDYVFYIEDKPQSEERKILIRHEPTNTKFTGVLAPQQALIDVPYRKVPSRVIEDFFK